MRAAFVLGRAIFGGFFVYNGLNHFQHRAQLSGYAASKGTPSPEAAVLGTGAMLVGAGASVIAGIRPRRGLAAIVGFLVPVSLQMHRFWEIADPQQRQNEMVNFSKNMALAGAALALMQIREPWPASIGQSRGAQVHETYPGFTIRELRRLPA